MKIVLGLVGTLTLLVILVWIIGARLPVKHRASVSELFNSPPEEMWRVLTDYQAYPSWRSDIDSVTKIQTEDNREVWQEQAHNGEVISYATTESKHNELLTREIVTQGLPYGGRWLFQLESTHPGCTLTITEQGEVYNAVFRFVSRYVIGHSASMEKFMLDLKKTEDT